jgi:hypothetical protein
MNLSLNVDANLITVDAVEKLAFGCEDFVSLTLFDGRSGNQGHRFLISFDFSSANGFLLIMLIFDGIL